MLKIANLLVILSLCCVLAIAAPYQELAPRAGHVPVYIREGNTPLSEIHPSLVEAFHEEGQYSKLQLEAKESEEVLLPNNAKKEETVNDKAEEKEEVKEEINKSTNQAEHGDESIKDVSAKVEEITVSDIAELNNDDLKIFADDEAEH